MAEQVTKKRRPKSANGDGGCNRRPDNLWRCRATIVLPDGTQKRLEAASPDQARAKQLLAEKVAKAQQGIDLNANRQTVAAYLTWWLAEVVEPARSPKTHTSYREIVQRHILPTLGKVELGRLTAQQVKTLLRSIERQGKQRTAGYARAVLHTALQDAVRLDAIPRNVAANVDPPKKPRTERQPYTPEEARQLFAATEGDRLAALYRITITLGLRRGEALGLRWEDVDLNANTVHVRRNLQRIDRDQMRPDFVTVAADRKRGSVLILKEPKTQKSRRLLALPPSLADALRAHRDRQAFEQSAAGKNWQPHGLVFCTPIGTGIDPDNLTKQWKAALNRAGLRDQRFHDMRHAAGTMMLGDGMPVHEVSAILGHSLASTTLDIYAHVLPGTNERAAATMERLIGQIG